MNNIISNRRSRRTAFWISMHFFAMISIIAYESMLIFHIGLSITLKGCLIFLLQVIVYLANVTWVIPMAFHQGKSSAFGTRLAFLVCIYIFLRGLIIFKLLPVTSFIISVFSAEQQLYASLQVMLVLGTSLLLGFYKENEIMQISRENALRAYVKAVAEKEHIKTIVYQMQLNPHLTFNTLNAIKAQSEVVQPHVAKAAQLLSNILRHSLIDPLEQDMIGVRAVFDELKDLVALHQYLRSNKLFIILKEECDPNLDSFKLPPGLIFTLAENVFHHGHLHEEEYGATLTLAFRDTTLTFSTFNFKKFGIYKGSGLGLKNARILLDHYYPGRYTLQIEDLEHTFTLTLIVSL